MTQFPQRQYLPDHPHEVQDLLYAGEKIGAIKLLRENQGMGLREAKELADRMEAELRQLAPNDMPPARSAGCGSAVALIATLGYVAGSFIA